MPCSALVPDCVTTITCAPARLPYSARIGVGEDVEFAHRVDAQQIAADAAGRDRELARPGVFDAVQQHQVVAGTPASTENVLPLLVLVLALFSS